LNKGNIGRAGFHRGSYGWTSSSQLLEIRSPWGWFHARGEHIEVIKLVELHWLCLRLNLQELNGGSCRICFKRVTILDSRIE